MPLREGEVAGRRPAFIYRDRVTGVPHIKADTLEDAVYAQGYTHAQDRLWQMEKSRRMVSGRLSEIFGEKTIGMDKFALTVGYLKIATETWEGQPFIEADSFPEEAHLTQKQR
jgi:penicillin amidase